MVPMFTKEVEIKSDIICFLFKFLIENKISICFQWLTVPKDYTKEEVTPEMLLKVLEGNQTLEKSGKKVVKSGPNDHIFVYFSDHGAPGMIAFPSDQLYATDLNKVLKRMAKQNKFKKMAIYIEGMFLIPRITVFYLFSYLKIQNKLTLNSLLYLRIT